MVKEQRLLEHILASVGSLVAPGTRIPAFASERQDLSVVATALLRKAYLQAGAVLALARTASPESAVPNLRSIAEAWGELHHLLTGEGAPERAQMAFLFALREIRDFHRKFGGEADDLARIETELAAKTAAAPELMAKVERLGGYWTPVGRAKLVDQAFTSLFTQQGHAAPDSLGHRIYKLLSWDEHHVMATILSVGLDPNSPGFGTVKRQEAPEDPEAFLPMMAAMLLDGMHKQYRASILADEATGEPPAT